MAVSCHHFPDAALYPTGRNIPHLRDRMAAIACPKDNIELAIVINLDIISITDHSLDDNILSNAGQIIKCRQMVIRTEAIAKG